MVKLYLEHLKMNLKATLEYKSSFILNFISQFFIFFGLYFMIVGLFNKFSNIKGFTEYEVLLCFAVINFGFAFNETFFRGIDKFEDLIIDGSLDRFLLRPQGILFQVISEKMDLVKISRILQSLIILVIALVNIDIDWSASKVFVLIMMLISSVLIFFGLFVLMSSYCFITVKGLEIKNLMTDGGKHTAQYPIGIFRKGFAFIFTFILPYGFINYYPLLYLLGKSNNKLYIFSFVMIFIFLIPCLLSFKWGLKKYSSTGS